ncbi:MAG TPA: ferrous iron transport protein B [Polyangiaceae bacterium]|nr:ferrous iron transport protein B [Polyangiaceae bacterium]
MTARQSAGAVSAPSQAREGRPRRVVVVGNPNVGKTTLFNALTRQNARVGNYPGITVECRTGKLVGSAEEPAAEVMDVPGAYSLSARSSEEQIAIAAILGLGEVPRPDLCLVVTDAGQLIRNLYLALQVVELGVPVVLCLNMIDEVRENPPRAEAVSRVFGVPCVATDARSGTGIEELSSVLRASLESPRTGSVEVRYPPSLRADVDAIAERLPRAWRSSVERDRALARWALTSIDEDDELVSIPGDVRAAVMDVRARLEADRDIDREIIGARYAFLDAIAPSLLTRAHEERRRAHPSERIDRVLIHPVFGFGIFLALMMVLFQSLFTWADPAVRLIERFVGFLEAETLSYFGPSFVRDLFVQGVLGGVGNVVVFLPQIVLLFLFTGILEDSGYMARVAYLMDRIMRALGLHGRAFVPMLSGFACAIPAILSTRTMERRRDRLLTMLVIPLMTCSARLPVYTLIIGALFPPTRVFGWLPVQGLLMIGMYLFATGVALVSALVLGRLAVRGSKIPLILELPPYRLPKLSVTLRFIIERARSFLTEAGTMILACTIALWVLLSYPKPDHVPPNLPAAAIAQQTIQHSYAGRLGHLIEPAIRPLGFDWKIGVGLIGAFSAREVFVSTMGLVYGVGNDAKNVAPLRDRMRAETRTDGKPAYTPLMGLSLMVFFAIACQCVSTLAVVRRETKSLRWPAFLFGYTVLLAWIASFAVYQSGRLLLGL